MTLTIERKYKTSKSVIGELSVNGLFECFTLEDPDESGDRIPVGTYSVVLDHSTRFNRIMPHVLGNGVNERGIRIHCGNTEADTIGCILVGAAHDGDTISLSKLAYFQLFKQLEGQKDITLTIS